MGQHESSLSLQLATHDERRTGARSSPASTNSSRREVLLGWLHELQQRSKQLLQPESAELPVMQWAMVCLGSIKAVSRLFCCLLMSEILIQGGDAFVRGAI